MNRSVRRFSIPLLTLLMLIITVQPVSAQETADLAITKTADQKNVKIGETITFTTTLTNLGPGTATNIIFGDALPDPLNVVSFSCSLGTVSPESFCLVDRLESGESVTATLVAAPIPNPSKSERKTRNVAFIAEYTAFDPDLTNNSDSVRFNIIGNIR
jgi:uncharacterized repeat protein (TIGR01451 family)